MVCFTYFKWWSCFLLLSKYWTFASWHSIYKKLFGHHFSLSSNAFTFLWKFLPRPLKTMAIDWFKWWYDTYHSLTVDKRKASTKNNKNIYWNNWVHSTLSLICSQPINTRILYHWYQLWTLSMTILLLLTFLVCLHLSQFSSLQVDIK